MDHKGKATKKNKKKVANFIIDFTQWQGTGQYGDVYKAVNQDNNEEVAVKIIDKQQIYDDDYTKNALIREIEIMKNLKNPNIIQFIDIQETTNNIYIFEELAADGTLCHILKKHKRLDQKSALGYIVQLLSGFSELIKHGIIHRDIKPTNILMKGNTVKIADFGLSRYSDTMSSMNSAVGTPVYMAPQILQKTKDGGCKYTYKCDIWSFGVLCYELVTGNVPWTNTQNCDLKELFSRIKQQSEFQVSENYKDLVRGCLRFQEKDRFDWSEIYHHKLFEHKFKQMEAKTESTMEQNFTLTEIRLKVHSNNVNLQKFMAKMPQKLSKQQFFNLLKTLDDQITQKESNNLFKFFAKNSNQIQKKVLLQNLQNHGIKLKGLKSKATVPQGSEKKVENIIQTIAKNVEQKEVDLFELLNSFDKNKKNMLYKQQFSQFIKSLYPTATNEQIDSIFLYFNPENIKGIRLNAFYEKLCKVIQVPAVKDEHISKQIKKMEERKKH